MPRRGTVSLATGQVSAHGQGFAWRSPLRVRVQACAMRLCASHALAWIHAPRPSSHVPSATRSAMKTTHSQDDRRGSGRGVHAHSTPSAISRSRFIGAARHTPAWRAARRFRRAPCRPRRRARRPIPETAPSVSRASPVFWKALETLNRRHARLGDGNAPSNSGKAMAGAWMRPRWAIFARDVAPYCHHRGRPHHPRQLRGGAAQARLRAARQVGRAADHFPHRARQRLRHCRGPASGRRRLSDQGREPAASACAHRGAVPARGACRAAAGRGGAVGARRAAPGPEALQRHVARHRRNAHVDGILDGACALQVSGTREKPRAADARSEPGGRRRHHHLPRQAHPPEIPRCRPALRCDRHRLWHGLPVEGLKRVRFSLRAKLALTALVLLALPWAGTLYVNEVERFLLEGQEQSLLATARAVATVLHERPQLLASATGHDDEVDAILLGLQRASSRVWVVDRSYQVVALAGRLKRGDEAAAEAPWWQPLVGWFIERPTEDFTESLPENVLATGRDIAAAMQGTPATLVRRTQDGRAVVMSAAHPIWSGDEVVGAVVVEETTNPIVSLKTAALERLLLLTLAVFAGAAVLLMAFASRLSLRIRRLRDEAESAIDARGRITRLAAGSDASDEIGDLSRSFSAVLARLAQHHAYLESMAGRLSHELRTPIAVVRSSLENLKLAPEGSEARRYI